MAHYSIKFESLEEMRAAVDEILNGKIIDGRPLHKDCFKESWSGASSREHATELAVNGLPRDGIKAIDVAAEKINEMGLKVKNQGFQAMYADSGDEVDIARWLSGEEDHMLSWELSSESVRPVATLFVELAASSGISAKEIQEHGYQIMAAVEAIDASGMQTEIYVCWTSTSDSTSYRSMVKVKDAGEVFNPGRLMFAITHPSMLRVWMFAMLLKICDDNKISVPWGYGMPCKGRNGLKYGKDDFPETFAYIPGVGHIDAPNVARDVLRELQLID